MWLLIFSEGPLRVFILLGDHTRQDRSVSPLITYDSLCSPHKDRSWVSFFIMNAEAND